MALFSSLADSLQWCGGPHSPVRGTLLHTNNGEVSRRCRRGLQTRKTGGGEWERGGRAIRLRSSECRGNRTPEHCRLMSVSMSMGFASRWRWGPRCCWMRPAQPIGTFLLLGMREALRGGRVSRSSATRRSVLAVTGSRRGAVRQGEGPMRLRYRIDQDFGIMAANTFIACI